MRPAWHFGFQHNYCLILNKGGIKNKWNGPKVNHDKTFDTDVFMNYQNGYRAKGNVWHPQAIQLSMTEKFVMLLSNKDDVVLDPFLGSGTTAVACEKLDRFFIGIEFKEKYFKMAKDRRDQFRRDYMSYLTGFAPAKKKSNGKFWKIP